jgi:tetratricopeptide (TPR) repeat protein
MRVRSWPIGDVRRSGAVKPSSRSRLRIVVSSLLVVALAGCAGLDFGRTPRPSEPPLTASAALGQNDSRRDASLRLVIAGLDEDSAGRPDRALASYQRAVRVDATNPFAYLALARHHVESGSPTEASAFLDQARSLFEAEGRLGPSVDVWGIGLRAWIDRDEGRDERADARFRTARELGPEIWADERLSADELR